MRKGIATELLYKMISEALATTLDHERGNHGGRPCYNERTNLIAWIAHCLLIEPEHMPRIQDRLVEYMRIQEHRHGKE